MQDNRLIHWLIHRGVSQSVIDEFGVCFYQHPIIGQSIRIPISSEWSKYRRDPAQNIKPKYIYDKGGKATLFGFNKIKKEHKTILLTEGELDCLLAWSNNIPAISSTGGANTFLPEWVDLLSEKEIIIAYDNDNAGAQGMVKVLSYIPTAKIVLIPERPNIKDLTDYIKHGGDIHTLIRSGKTYTSIEQIKEERAQRISVFDSVRFHDTYIEAHTTVNPYKSEYKQTRKDVGDLERAKSVPITSFCEFSGRPPKRKCIWHNEKTASLVYFPQNNHVHCFGACGKHGDSIDVYRQIYNCSFKEAINSLNKMI